MVYTSTRRPLGASPAEVLLALLLVGAVAVVSVTLVRLERARTRDAIRIADMSQIAAALRVLNSVEGSFRSAGNGCSAGDSVAKCTFGTYLPSAAKLADPNGTPYTVRHVPDASGFAIAFTLERGFGEYAKGEHVLTEQGVR